MAQKRRHAVMTGRAPPTAMGSKSGSWARCQDEPAVMPRRRSALDRPLKSPVQDHVIAGDGRTPAVLTPEARHVLSDVIEDSPIPPQSRRPRFRSDTLPAFAPEAAETARVQAFSHGACRMTATPAVRHVQRDPGAGSTAPGPVIKSVLWFEIRRRSPCPRHPSRKRSRSGAASAPRARHARDRHAAGRSRERPL